MTILAFGAMNHQSAPSFAEVMLTWLLLGLLELFRRRWPSPESRET
jgi:hypothetical protein